MTKVEYVYTKPEATRAPPRKSRRKLVEVAAFVAIMTVSAYLLFVYKVIPSGGQNENSNQTLTNKTFRSGNDTFTIPSLPPDYKKSDALNYIRNNSAPELAKAESMCTSQFGGNWVNILDAMGCYNMQGFSTEYCSNELIQTLVSLCNQMDGESECSSDHVVCSV